MRTLASAISRNGCSGKEGGSAISLIFLRVDVLQHFAQLNAIKMKKARELPLTEEFPLVCFCSQQIEPNRRGLISLLLVAIGA